MHTSAYAGKSSPGCLGIYSVDTPSDNATINQVYMLFLEELTEQVEAKNMNVFNISSRSLITSGYGLWIEAEIQISELRELFHP